MRLAHRGGDVEQPTQQVLDVLWGEYVSKTGAFRPKAFSRPEGMGWRVCTSGLRSRDGCVSAFEARRVYQACPVLL